MQQPGRGHLLADKRLAARALDSHGGEREERHAVRSAPDLHAYLRQQAVGLVQIDGMLVVDARGAILAHSRLSPGSEPAVSFTDGEAIQALRDTPNLHSYVGTAKASRVDGRLPLDEEFQRVADKRWAKLLATGNTVPWADAKAYLDARLRGERPRRPLARKLGR